MSVLVVGGNGQLGRHLRAELAEATFWDRSVADLAHPGDLQERIIAAAPKAIVIAAAYTAVDKAESESELAWRVNAEAPAIIARAAHALDVPLVHISTDYVFDGSKPDGYTEEDGTRPLGQYGRSKLGGELAIASLCRKHWILRTSWVFSEHGHNFVKTMVRLAREREELRVVEDQRGQPTYAGDLARCIVALLGTRDSQDAPPWGVLHVGSGPVVSWREFADTILSRALAFNLPLRARRVAGITSLEYPTPARRPQNSVLISNAAWSRWCQDPFDWQRGLDHVLRTLAEAQ